MSFVGTKLHSLGVGVNIKCFVRAIEHSISIKMTVGMLLARPQTLDEKKNGTDKMKMSDERKRETTTTTMMTRADEAMKQQVDVVVIIKRSHETSE